MNLKNGYQSSNDYSLNQTQTISTLYNSFSNNNNQFVNNNYIIDSTPFYLTQNYSFISEPLSNYYYANNTDLSNSNVSAKSPNIQKSPNYKKAPEYIGDTVTMSTQNLTNNSISKQNNNIQYVENTYLSLDPIQICTKNIQYLHPEYNNIEYGHVVTNQCEEY